MPVSSRARRLPLVIVALALLAPTPFNTPLVAQTKQQISVETLIYDLKSPDAGRRQNAARDLGALKHIGAIPDLVAMAHDPSAPVRREVELSLERMEAIQTLPGFIAFATDSENDIRARAVTSLVNIHLSKATGFMATLSKLGDVIFIAADRDVELVVEPDVPVDSSVIETLRTRLTDSERNIRRTAIRGLGILRARQAVPDLLQVIREDRDNALRFDGVRAIRKIDDRTIADQLVALLNINTDSVRNELMTTLGYMRYRGAVQELMKIVDQSKPNDTGRVVALAALADIGDPTPMPMFERLKADKNENIRLYANEGIARTADAEQKTAISAARLIEKSGPVRTAQAFALLRIGESEYLDELIRALDKTSTRELAKEYLLETKPVDRPALFAPRTVSSVARAELADVLGRMGDANALPWLQELSHDSDSDVAKAAELATRRIATISGSQER
jgi:HEAT repeat protein